ncbi:MAG: hypothetical protein ACJASX_002728 [Limisphaerales bacterium]|jgi:hypothetical protein
MNELIDSISVALGHQWEWLIGTSIKVTVWLLLVLAILQLRRKTSASWLAGKTKLLSSEDGSELFHQLKPGTDILSAPNIITRALQPTSIVIEAVILLCFIPNHSSAASVPASAPIPSSTPLMRSPSMRKR